MLKAHLELINLRGSAAQAGSNAFIGWWDRNEALRVMKRRLMWANYGFPAKPGAKWPEWGPRAAGRRERPRGPFGTIPGSTDI